MVHLADVATWSCVQCVLLGQLAPARSSPLSDQATPVVSLISDLIIESTDGQPSWQFVDPRGVCVDPKSQDILVVDAGTGLLLRFDSSGGFLRSISDISLSKATSIAADDLGFIYSADHAGLTISNPLGGGIGGFAWPFEAGIPRSIKILPDGDILISMFEVMKQQVLHRFDREGNHLGSFCDSYAKGRDVDYRIEQVIAGGTIDLGLDGEIYYSQIWPYEIRVLTPRGVLLRQIHRQNSFIEEPSAHTSGDTVVVGPVSGSYAILATSHHELLINMVKRHSEPRHMSTTVEVLDTNGRLLGSQLFPETMIIRCKDGLDRIYATLHEDSPSVVRYKLSVAMNMDPPFATRNKGEVK